MKIGLDIDATMYRLDVIERVSELLGEEYTSEDIKHWVYDKEEINGMPKHFTDLVFSHFGDPMYMGNLKLNPYVRKKVHEWKDTGHELYVLTARKPEVHIATVKMLNRDFGVGFFKSIHMVEHKTDAKSKLFKDLELDVWIDDNPKDLVKASEMGINTYAINNSVTQYNTSKVNWCIEKYKHCKKVSNFGEIVL